MYTLGLKELPAKRLRDHLQGTALQFQVISDHIPSALGLQLGNLE